MSNCGIQHISLSSSGKTVNIAFLWISDYISRKQWKSTGKLYFNDSKS